MIASATSGNMSGYQQTPSYGNFDPRWSSSQPVGYDPNMPYPPYDMEQPYIPPQDPQAVYGANVSYFTTGDPRYLQSQAYLLPQSVPARPPATYQRPTDAPEPEKIPDAMDIDAREEGELSSCEEIVEQRSPNAERPYAPYAQRSGNVRQSGAGLNAHINEPQPKLTSTNAHRPVQDSLEKAKPAKEDAHVSPLAGKSPSQLKALAQGALLNLAPHKIRYNELVREGIDPIVLKSLYDEIGIKITVEPTSKPAGVAQGPGEPKTSDTLPSSLTTKPIAQAKPATKQPSGQDADANFNKPMERKDVIARMLAAKAAKSTASSAPTAKITKSDQTTTSSSQPTKMAIRSLNDDSTQSAQTSAQDAREEVRVKEKNKAQTELARQRMEQLKKLGLGKSTSQIPGLTSSPSTSNADTPVSTAPQELPSLSHPLPDRPPLSGMAVPTQIPGLVMTGPDSHNMNDSISTGKPQDTLKDKAETPRAPRKRPRASDFTDDPDETQARKHPLSGPRSASAEQRVIIDISDDEAMYGSDIETGGIPNTTNTSHPSRSTKSTTRELPPLPDFPPRSRSSHRSTPVSISNTPPNPANGLIQKNMEILAMRQKIAELEARRIKKQASSQNQSSGSSNASAGITSDGILQETENSSSELENVQKTPTPTVEQSTSGTVEPTSAMSSVRDVSTPQPTLGSNRAEELRLKALRRKEIESGLPLLDAELLKSEQRLAEFREQEKRLIEEIAKGREGKRKLIEELEGLGIETEGFSMTELKEISCEVASGNGSKQEVPVAKMATNQDIQKPEVGSPADTKEGPRTGIPGLTEARRSIEDHSNQKEREALEIGSVQDAVMDDTSSCEPQETREGSYSSSAMDESMGSSEDESGEESTSLAKSTPLGSPYGDEMVTTREPSLSTEDKIMEPLSPGLDNNGKPQFTPREESVTSEGYEPPEPDTLESPPFSPAPPQPIEPISMETRPAAPEDPDAHTLTLSEQEAACPAVLEPSTNDADAPSHQSTYRFSPYRSPLKLFRAYRYHPDFTNHTSGGFRSLTYSHNIDPHKPLCDLEIAGGVCDAPSCGFQHFRDMNLSDDKILVEMGSLREGKTPAEREEYVTGLRQIINDMRRDKVKDFSIVAQEIAAYRRRFLQDPSRVLAL
ncbi:hypothetical protein MGYG_04470 [Nannizzia gypsea CBS 118893]|uniref:Putative zinc-finger domain-containing protein n=1 Tax=Arthroderma gypseum (strain ATCC MYA-4604 / CBS 118893) TaxID=535722 RepID=E4UT66_ARTGP|nr:hypothetical protein MGYG_04470 [Nannizzia gypsea CBS 118893]EFR01462.1 hypothetical protein MGYG_04470 [Nannizzia gypsea CBS 118893]